MKKAQKHVKCDSNKTYKKFFLIYDVCIGDSGTSCHHLIFYSLKTVVQRNCVGLQSSYTYTYNKMLW